MISLYLRFWASYNWTLCALKSVWALHHTLYWAFEVHYEHGFHIDFDNVYLKFVILFIQIYKIQLTKIIIIFKNQNSNFREVEMKFYFYRIFKFLICLFFYNNYSEIKYIFLLTGESNNKVLWKKNKNKYIFL